MHHTSQELKTESVDNGHVCSLDLVPCSKMPCGIGEQSSVQHKESHASYISRVKDRDCVAHENHVSYEVDNGHVCSLGLVPCSKMPCGIGEQVV